MSFIEFKNNKKIEYLTFFAIFNIALILLLSLNSFYHSDDYGFMIDLKQNGIIDNCINGYYNWDGRFLSLGAFVQGFCLLYLPVELIVFIWSLCFLTSGIFIFLILDLELKFQFSNPKTKIFAALMIILIFWFGSYYHFSETIYWATGGVYSFALLQGSIFTYLFLKLQNSKSNLLVKICFLIFAFVVGSSTQNLSVPILILIIIHLILDFLIAKKVNFIFNILIFIVALLGLIFISTAPGNMFRIKAVNYDFQTQFSFFVILKNFFTLSVRFIYHSLFAIFLSFFSTISIAYFMNKKINFNFDSFFKLPRDKNQIADLLQNYKWFFVAISSILPFVAIPVFTGKRAIIYFQFFIIIFVFSFVFRHIALLLDKKYRKPNNDLLPIFIISIIMFGCLVLLIYNFNKSYQLKSKVIERENLLKVSNGKTVHIKLINPDLNGNCFIFPDFADESEYIKTTQEIFFGVKIIVDK